MHGRLVACHDCDAVYRQIPLAAGEKARCRRCGAVLYKAQRLLPGQMLALVLAALVTFIIANAFPIVALNVQGVENEATLFGSVLALWDDGRRTVACTVFATTMLAPVCDLTLMAVVLAAAASGRRPRHFAQLLRLVQAIRPWGMIEIFMLGILVALVKLSHFALLVPGISLWAFGALTVLLALVASWDMGSLWQAPGVRRNR